MDLTTNKVSSSRRIQICNDFFFSNLHTQKLQNHQFSVSQMKSDPLFIHGGNPTHAVCSISFFVGCTGYLLWLWYCKWTPSKESRSTTSTTSPRMNSSSSPTVTSINVLPMYSRLGPLALIHSLLKSSSLLRSSTLAYVHTCRYFVFCRYLSPVFFSY